MRYSPDHKAATRERVLREAATALREHGTAGVSVADIMKRAGLTHGGFYAHFESKDDMIGHAVEYMFDQRYATVLSYEGLKDPGEALAAFVDDYLSLDHRDRPETGCPIPALSAELSRMESGACLQFRNGYERLVVRMSKLLRPAHGANATPLTKSALAEMVGSLVVARALPDPESANFLKNARSQVKSRLGSGRKKAS
ncbi:TetR family transcriptional regulator [Panacagrimonas perspica]|uniref:TetR family transcriptional regulator n=1 Tax=Panacagrimonas perspica TaxID=381431 RepID=A0A4S3K2Q6_9GAMM|nr:TetR/AcrR family transcriptional regulator [Panacagrimonas perspica]TDU28883.1 TetR family transcriptional regulator [Panacagrimonas perspica]THD02290.1 hypothetical protein B1810_15290 [Panacagrimonas perspica]